MWLLKCLAIKFFLMVLAHQSSAQFKILGVSSTRSRGGGENGITLVQIKPLQQRHTDAVESRSFGDSLQDPSVAMIDANLDNNITNTPIKSTTPVTSAATLMTSSSKSPVPIPTSRIIKLQIMNSTEAVNISAREGKLQYDNQRTDNDIINISPLRPSATIGSPTSSHRRRATGSIKLTNNNIGGTNSGGVEVRESELFYINKHSQSKPSSSSTFKKQHPQTLPKENDIRDHSASIVQRYKRRKYKSKCRCERIWNCPRIQISIARCAPDYFMCCF
ncbi:uncharacterized protein LOC129746563 [Uranotaenia lowii]|uniref:uncharacterized protein LOC129746563 n=1 Tax=Uranotaenia lowii TaxID=190385 RepID=UPI00247A61E6|nr:uncharacterized protein LOC129746563 [Uranotaenia lowii]